MFAWLEKINIASEKYGLDEEGKRWMVRVMYCESGGYQEAYNPTTLCYRYNKNGQCTEYSNAMGIYQYMMPTWKDHWNFNRDEDINSGDAQIESTAYKYSLGGKGLWECK